MSFRFFLPLLSYPDATPRAGLLRAFDVEVFSPFEQPWWRGAEVGADRADDVEDPADHDAPPGEDAVGQEDLLALVALVESVEAEGTVTASIEGQAVRIENHTAQRVHYRVVEAGTASAAIEQALEALLKG